MRPQPPITSTPYTSLLLPPPPGSPPTNPQLSPADVITYVNRQTLHAQNSLQALLDAQSAGLLAGLGQSPSSPQSPKAQRQRQRQYKHDSRRERYTDSPTPTTSRSVSSSSTTSSARQTPGATAPTIPKKGGLSLHAARTGIHSNLTFLAQLKARESGALSTQLTQQETDLAAITAAKAKENGIETAIAQIEAHETTGRVAVQKLEAQEKELEGEVYALEERLAELRANLRVIKAKRTESENKLEGRLSSWRHAKAEVEKRMQEEFLKRPRSRILKASLGKPRAEDQGRSRTPTPSGSRNGGSDVGKEASVWDLPLERRTVQLVREELEGDIVSLKGRIESVEEERGACEAGVGVWGRCVGVVEGVERTLKGILEGSGGGGGDGGSEDGNTEGGMRTVLREMDGAIEILDREERMAEEKEWNLLVCAIGAELEALKLGREMLVGAVEQVGKMGVGKGEVESAQGGEEVDTNADVGVATRSRGMDEHDLSDLQQGEGGGRSAVADLAELERGGEGETDEDDGPGEDLLFSR